MTIRRRVWVGGWVAMTFLRASSAAAPGSHIVGHYSDAQLAEGRTLILPRVFLYDASNHLVPDDQWPIELAEVKKHKGQGRCCFSYTPHSSSGPPPECANPVYGDQGANLSGLTDDAGSKIDFASAPPHQWLIVEYAATRSE